VARSSSTALLSVLAAASACGGPSSKNVAPTAGERVTAQAHRAPDREPDTFSPQPIRDRTGLLPTCAAHDAALTRVAEALVERLARGDAAFDALELQARLREEGSPYVWPHAFTLASPTLTAEAARERLRGWLSSFDDHGVRRCGIARNELDARTIVAAVAVDALAEVEPMPARVEPGTWLDLRATMVVPFGGAKVAVLGPRGLPRTLLTEVAGNQILARFSADSPGGWLVQVLSEVEAGVRPVLEVTVVAGEGPRDPSVQPAPGEAPTPEPDAAAPALLGMLNAARASEGLAPLSVDFGLSELAAAHAEQMREQRRAAHDVGDGPPDERVADAGLHMTAVGENVCLAPELRLAHRALWASPSHRSNILSRYFDSIGIGVASDRDGSVWVSELFARRGD
jgi:hypothetical protein